MTPLLRIYEGCGRALSGTVDGTTIVKLNRLEPKVSYLSYPDFDRDPHPALAVSVRSDLRRLDVKFTDFRISKNPPILHRKETFVGAEYPEDHLTIGTRDGWQSALEDRHMCLRGHRLVRLRV